MKPVVFAGPSIYGIDGSHLSKVSLRPPAASGDLLHAVRQGAGIIGLIDGLYGDCAAVWHKEILYAISNGVAVVGSASMGALRAAECSPFGMIGVGEIFEAYRDGRRVSDADVAVTHAPADLEYRPLTISLVDAEATIEKHQEHLTPFEQARLLDAARRLHFANRTWRAIVERSGLEDRYAKMFREGEVSIKRKDAMRLLEMLARGELTSSSPCFWTFQNTMFFQELCKRNMPSGET